HLAHINLIDAAEAGYELGWRIDVRAPLADDGIADGLKPGLDMSKHGLPALVGETGPVRNVGRKGVRQVNKSLGAQDGIGRRERGGPGAHDVVSGVLLWELCVGGVVHGDSVPHWITVVVVMLVISQLPVDGERRRT